MGGGDLNLKKSWHPSTMKNIEKVWKAEQQESQEKKRIAELKKEIEMEKDREDIKKYAMEQNVIEKKEDKKLDWMYKRPNQLINREEYLLGRPIDKSFEQMVQEEKNTEVNHTPRNHVEHECVPPSLRFFSGNEQVDLARKMQEDPLYAIKKKEMETRSQLLKNPVKLKQLRQLLEQQSKKEKSEKKERKRKKKKHRQSDDSNDETQLDILLAAKYKQLKDKINDKELMNSMTKIKRKRKKRVRQDSNCSSDESENCRAESSDDEDVASHKKEKKSKSGKNKVQPDKDRNERYIAEASREKNKELKIFERKRIRNGSSSNERSSGMVYEKRSKTDKKGTDRDENQDFHSSSSQNKRLSDKYNGRMNNRTSENEIEKQYKQRERNGGKWNLKKKQHLTEEEKERRRREMVSNATWRNKERERNIKKYREEEKKEVDNSKTYNEDFIRKQLVTATETGTVASRIKANINNIQRSGRAMDTNFAKR